MILVDPSFEILFLQSGDDVLKLIEIAGRTCYKSEDNITSKSAAIFVRQILKSGHHSVIEHAGMTVKFTCDRGVTHELVRHRLAAYSQESTRYANYSKDKFGREITVVKPSFWKSDPEKYAVWLEAMQSAERAYMTLTSMGAKAQEARSVLINSLKTEIVMTTNMREWRHVFDLRCSSAAHPQIREIMLDLLNEVHARVPVLFDDLYDKYC